MAREKDAKLINANEPAESLSNQSNDTCPEAVLDAKANLPDLYRLIDSRPTDEILQIHISFLRQVRRLLMDELRHKQARDFRQNLRALCIAHDILKDPATKTDYDEGQIAKDINGQIAFACSVSNHIKIGELLEAAQILDEKELDIALDMHKAMPDVHFGEFLVKQDFLGKNVLASALLGQRLLDNGKITIQQFETAMRKVSVNQTAFCEVLLLSGWISQDDLDDVIGQLPPDLQAAMDSDCRPWDVSKILRERLRLEIIRLEKEAALARDDQVSA